MGQTIVSGKQRGYRLTFTVPGDKDGALLGHIGQIRWDAEPRDRSSHADLPSAPDFRWWCRGVRRRSCRRACPSAVPPPHITTHPVCSGKVKILERAETWVNAHPLRMAFGRRYAPIL